jgi:hypothetical protein
VCGYVEEGLKRPEARLVIGGLPPKEGPLGEGYYHPTIWPISLMPCALVPLVAKGSSRVV